MRRVTSNDLPILPNPKFLIDLRVHAPVIPNEILSQGLARPAWTGGGARGSDLSGWDDDAIEKTVEFTLWALGANGSQFRNRNDRGTVRTVDHSPGG